MCFLKEKSALTECSPRASCYLEQKVGGFWILCCSKELLSWSSPLGDMHFFEWKSALTECSPWASCYLEQKVGGSWILCFLKTPVLKNSSEWCALFWRKSALTKCSPRASCYLERRVGGSWIWVVQRTENLSCCSPLAYIWVLLLKKNWILAYSLVVRGRQARVLLGLRYRPRHSCRRVVVIFLLL